MIENKCCLNGRLVTVINRNATIFGMRFNSWNITRCAYAEMYKKLGMEDLGFEFSCARDFAMVDGFNPLMTLKRTKTIMQGDEHCDFRLSLK